MNHQSQSLPIRAFIRPVPPPLRRLLPLLCILAAVGAANAADSPAPRQWTVDGVVREALVYAPPEAANPAPIIFAFHGHGGSMRGAARSFNFQDLWPQAITVYMQGLNTPGVLVDHDGKFPGWESSPGADGDRDLKFFDAVLASLQHDYRVDAKRIYAAGHSNGGAFTYLLWAERGENFAAFAPSGAFAAKRALPKLKPKPVLHIAGQKDNLVKFEWQQKMMDDLRALNQCGEGEPWENQSGCTLYPSKIGAPVVTFIFPGAHQYPTNASALVVKFFQQHALP